MYSIIMFCAIRPRALSPSPFLHLTGFFYHLGIPKYGPCSLASHSHNDFTLSFCLSDPCYVDG